MEDNDFKIIGITLPQEHPGGSRLEAELISRYLESGAIEWIHIRKPGASEPYTDAVLSEIPSRLLPRITLHSHFNLSDKYPVGGLHLKNSPGIPTNKSLRLSRSCHSVEELGTEDINRYTYSFLSPIYDSISKKGYHAAFDLSDGNLPFFIEGKNVVALGGVVPDKFKELFRLKFAGAALLGYLWSQNTIDTQIMELLRGRKLLVSS